MRTHLILAVLALVMLSTSAMKLQNHQGQYAYYTYNQTRLANRCLTNDQCDGQRTCSYFFWCQGVSRPPKLIYKYNETSPTADAPAQLMIPTMPTETTIATGKDVVWEMDSAFEEQDDSHQQEYLSKFKFSSSSSSSCDKNTT